MARLLSFTTLDAPVHCICSQRCDAQWAPVLREWCYIQTGVGRVSKPLLYHSGPSEVCSLCIPQTKSWWGRAALRRAAPTCPQSHCPRIRNTYMDEQLGSRNLRVNGLCGDGHRDPPRRSLKRHTSGLHEGTRHRPPDANRLRLHKWRPGLRFQSSELLVRMSQIFHRAAREDHAI